MLKLAKLKRDENGNGLLISFIVLVFMLGIAGLVVDASILYKTKGEMKKAANAAVLSGGQVLFVSDDQDVVTSTVTKTVNDILKAHNEESSLQSPIQIKPDGKNEVSVTLKKNVSLYFMRVFGLDSVPIQVKSSAEVNPLVTGDHVVPLGIEKSEIDKLTYGTPYPLKVGAGDSEYGNFGILALTGPGAQDYGADLMYGCTKDISVGQIIDTQTGNITDKTRDGVQYRLDQSSDKGFTPGPPYYDDDPRMVVVVIYEPVETQGNQLKQVKVVGFAYFYLDGPYDGAHSSITGRFVKMVGSGTGDETGLDKGAYAVKLVE